MMNLLFRPLGTRAAHVTPAGHERAPLSQAVRVLLKTDDRSVLVESIRQDENGFFTGEICSSGAEGRTVIQFREQHIFTYETAEDLEKRRATRLENPDAVPRLDTAEFDGEWLKPERKPEQIADFHFEPLAEQSTEPSIATTVSWNLQPPAQRRLKPLAVGPVCIALVIGGALGYMLPRKAKSPAIAIQVQDGEPAHLRLDYELKKP